MTREEIKQQCLPCPFCHEFLEPHERGAAWALRHQSTSTCVFMITNYYESAEELVDLWNRRKSEARIFPSGPPGRVGDRVEDIA
jgi:hypothetical protein